MVVYLLGRSLLRSGLQRLVFQRRCFCAAQSVLNTDISQQEDMIRNRTQIKRVLCVAEKNDAAKGISEIMSNGRSNRVSHTISEHSPTQNADSVTCDGDLLLPSQLTDSSTSSLSPQCQLAFPICGPPHTDYKITIPRFTYIS